MRLALFAVVGFAFTAHAAEQWRFHCECEKGDTTVAIARHPAPLDSYLFALPPYSPDPLAKETFIRGSTARSVGEFRGHRIVEAHLELEKNCYTDFYLLVYETERGLYLPIYAQQYSRGTRTPKMSLFTATDKRCSMIVTVLYSGTGAQQTTDEITLSYDGQKQLQLRCDRKT